MNSITIKKSPSPTQEQKDLKAFIHAKEFIPSQQKSFNFNSNINNNLNYNSSPQGIIPIDNSAYSNQYYNEIPYWMNEDNEGNDMYEKMAQLDKKERYQSNNKSIDYDNLLTGWEPMSEGYNNIKQDKNNDKFQYNNIDNNINNNIDFENLSNEWDPVSEVYDSRKQIKRENKSIYDKNNLLGYDKEKGMKQKNNKKEDWINNLLDDKTNEVNKNIFNTNEQVRKREGYKTRRQ
ncbi:hypothetical protein K502DRAFT_155251 [Neoconidiobolus thromboides FSU 785]|nr:hypothetical protein K502DRAFT_155251 [Neoconidiobolus thromboides FSU 785]